MQLRQECTPQRDGYQRDVAGTTISTSSSRRRIDRRRASGCLVNRQGTQLTLPIGAMKFRVCSPGEKELGHGAES